jgi:hypothetical protein
VSRRPAEAPFHDSRVEMPGRTIGNDRADFPRGRDVRHLRSRADQSKMEGMQSMVSEEH